MKTITAVIIGVVSLFLAVNASAYYRAEADVQVISDRGEIFNMISHRQYDAGSTGIIKKYLEARKGENYSIVVRNPLPERIGVVVAVDGRNIISGKRSNLKNSERMYVIEPYGEARLEGWRTDKETVHRFYFTDVADSYSARTFSDASAMGVIAVAVFREKHRPAALYEQQPMMGSAPAAPVSPRAESKAGRSDDAGTGFGEGRYSPVHTVEFEPEAYAFQKVLLKYEWRETLCRKGIIRCRPEGRNRLWDDDYAPYPPAH